MTLVFVVEEATKSHQSDNHGNVRDVQKHFSTETINQNCGDESCNEVDNTDDNRAKILIDCAASVFEDRYGVENDGINTRQLLEEHQAERYKKGLQVASFE